MLYAWLNEIIDELHNRIKNGLWPGSYLYELTQGLGADKLANEIMMRLLCKDKKNPGCGQCVACLSFIAETNPDILEVKKEEGTKSIKIDHLRECILKAEKSPTISSCQILLIQNAQDMTIQCANALLKTLEEPKKSLYIILQTDSLSKLLPTIKSRCQIESIKPNMEKLEAEMDQMISSDQRFEFLKYTHKTNPIGIKKMMENNEVYDLYENIVSSLSTEKWQPLAMAESFADFDLSEIVSAYLDCIGALHAEKSKIDCQQKKLFCALKKEFIQIAHTCISYCQIDEMQKILLQTKRLLEGSVVHTGSYLKESMLIRLWQCLKLEKVH